MFVVDVDEEVCIIKVSNYSMLMSRWREESCTRQKNISDVCIQFFVFVIVSPTKTNLTKLLEKFNYWTHLVTNKHYNLSIQFHKFMFVPSCPPSLCPLDTFQKNNSLTLISSSTENQIDSIFPFTIIFTIIILLINSLSSHAYFVLQQLFIFVEFLAPLSKVYP